MKYWSKLCSQAWCKKLKKFKWLGLGIVVAGLVLGWSVGSYITSQNRQDIEIYEATSESKIDGNWSSWSACSVPTCGTGTGGTITDVGGYTIHTFTSSGTFTPLTAMNVEVLVVAGGGAGGSGNRDAAAGGGGGGGIVYNDSYVAAGAITVTVGNGGVGGSGQGGKGESSIFGSLTAIGGGGGGKPGGGAGANGGCGGGGGISSIGKDAGGVGGIGSQGGNGGAGPTNWGAIAGAGGGGGGGGNGVAGLRHWGGNGGDGFAYSTSGSSMFYSGGGGGAVGWNAKGGCGEGGKGDCGEGGPGSGGNGGGGKGGFGAAGAAGVANRGGGGGGGAGTGGAGGKGVVIVRYITQNGETCSDEPICGQTGTRTRTCNNPTPSNGGRECIRSDNSITTSSNRVETESCITEECGCVPDGTTTCNPDCPITCGKAALMINTCKDSCGGATTKSCLSTAACPSISPDPSVSPSPSPSPSPFPPKQPDTGTPTWLTLGAMGLVVGIILVKKYGFR